MVYQARSVTDILKEMMSKSEVQFDLAIASLALNDRVLASKVIEIELEMDELANLLYMHASLSIRSPKDAEEYYFLFHIGNAVEGISDSAGNIAELVLNNRNPFESRNDVFFYIHEYVDACKVAPDSFLVGKKEVDLDLQELFGVDIMGFKRDEKIFLSHDIEFEEDDMLYVRGPNTNVFAFAELARNHVSSIDVAQKMINDLTTEHTISIRDYELDLQELINYPLLMIDLAYLSHLNQELLYKNSVRQLENLVDSTQTKYQQNLIDAFENKLITKLQFTSLLKLGSEMELVADEAFKLAFGIKSIKRSDIFLLQSVMEGSEENVEVFKIGPTSPFIGKSIREIELETKVTKEVFDVLALRSHGKVTPYPSDNTILKAFDFLVIKRYRVSEEFEDEEDE